MEEIDNQELDEKKIRILWETDDDAPFLYANQLYLSHGSGDEFHLFFGHLAPPMLYGLDESEFPETVNVKPVAKLVVSPKVMESFIKALNTNFEKYKEKMEIEDDRTND